MTKDLVKEELEEADEQDSSPRLYKVTIAAEVTIVIAAHDSNAARAQVFDAYARDVRQLTVTEIVEAITSVGPPVEIRSADEIPRSWARVLPYGTEATGRDCREYFGREDDGNGGEEA